MIGQYYAVNKSPDDELKHWKYKDKYKGKSGKWVYVYEGIKDRVSDEIKSRASDEIKSRASDEIKNQVDNLKTTLTTKNKSSKDAEKANNAGVKVTVTENAGTYSKYEKAETFMDKISNIKDAFDEHAEETAKKIKAGADKVSKLLKGIGDNIDDYKKALSSKDEADNFVTAAGASKYRKVTGSDGKTHSEEKKDRGTTEAQLKMVAARSNGRPNKAAEKAYQDWEDSKTLKGKLEDVVDVYKDHRWRSKTSKKPAAIGGAIMKIKKKSKRI